jgi:hypothetical protein
LATALDFVAARKADGNLDPAPEVLDQAADPLGRAVYLMVADRQIRKEHRQRIYNDLVTNRDFLVDKADRRLLDLVFWSEHIESLYRALRSKRLNEFHYARALEATCRRCGFDLLPAMGRMEELGKLWAGADYATTFDILAPTAPSAGPVDEAQAQA